MATIGGGTIREFSFSRAWGVNPSAATGVAVMDGGGSLGISVGDYVTYSFGSVASFPGVVTEVGEAVDFGGGRSFPFQVADNRVRLGWQTVFGAWNIEDDRLGKFNARPAAPSTGGSSSGHGADGVDGASGLDAAGDVEGAGSLAAPVAPEGIRRRYRHLLPEHWESGIWTFSDAPLTVAEILNSAFNHAWGDYGFSRSYPSSFSSAVLTGLDHTSGVKLANLVSEINGKTGMEVYLSGSRNLIWGRKGDGPLPVPNAADSWSSSQSLTSADTKVRVVGDPVLLQQGNIALEPDWQPGWQPYIDELAWLRAVKTAFEMPAATKADFCELAAFARRVTVREFAKKKADATLLDHRPFGMLSRNQLPAWVYIRELVYRSYRIPVDFTLHGVPLSSLEIADGLLCQMEITGDGEEAKQTYSAEPVVFYPSAQAQAIVMGQPLDLINARDIRLFYRRAVNNLNAAWTEAQDFEVDTVGKSIRFGVPTFIDGDPADGKSICLYPIQGEGGGTDITEEVAADSDFLDVAVPNPGFVITPAQVKAAFCFKVGRFYKDFGSGPRRGSIPANGLDLHLLDVSGGAAITHAGVATPAAGVVRLPVATNLKEILYQDGGNAAAKASEVASAMLGLSAIQTAGGFQRIGVAGTALSPVIDRVTVNITVSGGITERVDFTKARASAAAFSERSLQRIQRTEEAFSGQEALRREVRELKLLAHANRSAGTAPRSRAGAEINSAFDTPHGSENSATHVLRLPEGMSYAAGDVLWLDEEGLPTKNGTHFGGVVVAASSSEAVRVAYTGRVPVKILERIALNGNVFVNPGQSGGKPYGQLIIGHLAHGEATPDDTALLALVDLLPVSSLVRFRVSFDPEKQRLHVGPGMVAWIPAGGKGVIQPIEPRLGGRPLTEVPFWDMAAIPATDAQHVWCHISPGSAVMEKRLASNRPTAAEDEYWWLVAAVTWRAEGAVKVEQFIDQRWASDIEVVADDAWSSSSDSSSGSEGSSGSDDGSAGSDKSTAIVGASWTSGKFTALATLESPDVRFVDWVAEIRLTGRFTEYFIDRRFVEVCEPGSLRVFGVTTDRPFPVGVTLFGNSVTIRSLPWFRPRRVNLVIVGVRKGFGNWRFPNRRRDQYIANEATLNRAYPK